MNSTGENEKGLKEILDFTRLGAIIILLIHFYFYCYAAFKQWNLTAEIGNRFLQNLSKAGLFKSILYSKSIAIALLAISLMGARGRKDEKIKISTALCRRLSGRFHGIAGYGQSSHVNINIRIHYPTPSREINVVAGIHQERGR